jgi:mycothiol system anti-sigma-R factor
MAEPLSSKPQCNDALHELHHLLSGELDDARRAAIQAHLDECAPCAEPYDFYAEVRRCIQMRCQDEVPATLLAKIELAISEER